MWFYQDKEFTEDLIGDHIGFVYEIENLLTGKRYVGKKLFTFKKVKKPLKGKKNKRHSRIPSDWKDYYGSNDALKEDVKALGEKNFKRTILHLCKTKGSANYLEIKEIIDRNALVRENFYNEQIYCRIHKSQLKLKFHTS